MFYNGVAMHRTVCEHGISNLANFDLGRNINFRFKPYSDIADVVASYFFSNL